MWIGGQSLPDQAFEQNLTFEGCLVIFNVPSNPPPDYREKITSEIAKAYAANVLVLFILDDNVTLQDAPDWIDFLEFSYAVSPLRVIAKGFGGKIKLPFLPGERKSVLKRLGKQIWDHDKATFMTNNFKVMGSVSIEGKQVLMPLTEVNLANGNT